MMCARPTSGLCSAWQGLTGQVGESIKYCYLERNVHLGTQDLQCSLHKDFGLKISCYKFLEMQIFCGGQGGEGEGRGRIESQ